MRERVLITGAEAACAVGLSLPECLAELRAQRSGLTALASTGDFPELGAFAGLPSGRLPSRAPLKGRRYGAAANAAVHVARSAVGRAGWSGLETEGAWVFAASSRGNVGEMAGSNSWRRPIRKFSASNTMHSEIAAAVSIELGVRGPWQMLSNGCSSGLDALGLAWMAVAGGLAPRAIVVAVDLPFVPWLLQDFRDTGLLSTSHVNDPFALQEDATSGFLPGEAAAAVTLERAASQERALCALETYHANSDAHDTLRIPAGGGGIADCVRTVCESGATDRLVALCPHATGTVNHASVEPAAIQRGLAGRDVPLLPLKPYTGHTLGASGLLDVALLAGSLAEGWLPAVLPGLSSPANGMSLLRTETAVREGDRILKLASGMGGHNAAVSLRVI